MKLILTMTIILVMLTSCGKKEEWESFIIVNDIGSHDNV